jgi:hypothetical protein
MKKNDKLIQKNSFDSFKERIGKMREITFGGDGCVLSVVLTNLKDRSELEKHLSQCKIALRDYPRSKYWKDAIAFIEKKIERKRGIPQDENGN